MIYSKNRKGILMNCLQYIELLILGRKLSKNTEFKFRMHIFKKFFIPGKTTTQIPDKNKKIKRYVDIYLHPLELEFENDKSVYVAALIAIFHEFHHVKQFYDIKKGTAEYEIAISLLASQNNKEFYDENYKNLPYELEAEMIGVMNAYRYLLEKNPIFLHSRLLRTTLNLRSHMKTQDISNVALIFPKSIL